MAFNGIKNVEEVGRFTQRCVSIRVERLYSENTQNGSVVEFTRPQMRSEEDASNVFQSINLFKEAVLTLISGERQIGVLSTWSCGLLSCSRGWVVEDVKEKTRRKTVRPTLERTELARTINNVTKHTTKLSTNDVKML